MGKRYFYIVQFVFMVLAVQVVHAAQDGWSDWIRLEDRALNGIYFSHKKECSGGSSNCTLRWRWKNRYETDIAIDYSIAYETSGGTDTKQGRVKLQTGENESPTFALTGKAFEGVQVGVVASEEAKETARMQVERERQVKEEKRQREEMEARERQREAEEANRLAQLRAQEDRERQEEERREQKRQEQAEREAQHREKEASDTRFNQMIVDGFRDLSNSVV